MELHEIAVLISSGNGRLVAAGVLFLLMLAIKQVGWVKDNLLTTSRAKFLANMFLALAPATIMLAGDVPIRDVFTAALTMLLGAMGIHGGQKALRDDE